MDLHNELFANRIALATLEKFETLGTNGKPKDTEWVCLASIVKAELQGSDCNIEVVALGTGSKCLGESRHSCEGNMLRDCHAEVIARRAYKFYLLDQIESALRKRESIFVVSKEMCILKQHVSFHFYCSSTPCGDASIFPQPYSQLTQKKKLDDVQIYKDRTVTGSEEDKCLAKDLYRTGAKCVVGEEADPKTPGIDYHTTGVLRTKPGRGDPTLSHSCSDKIFKWTVLGVQGALPLLFLNGPIYLQTITIGSSPYDENAFRRAIYTRFEHKLHTFTLLPLFQVHTPKLLKSDVDFPYLRSNARTIPSPTSLVWSKTHIHIKKHEVIVEGRRLGITKNMGPSAKSELSICRAQFLRKVFCLLDVLQSQLDVLSYSVVLTSASGFQSGLREHSVSESNYRLGLNTIVTMVMEHSQYSECQRNFCEVLVEMRKNLNYGEMKAFSVTYQKMWHALNTSVLVHWTKKNEDMKNFQLQN